MGHQLTLLFSAQSVPCIICTQNHRMFREQNQQNIYFMQKESMIIYCLAPKIDSASQRRSIGPTSLGVKGMFTLCFNLRSTHIGLICRWAYTRSKAIVRERQIYLREGARCFWAYRQGNTGIVSLVSVDYTDQPSGSCTILSSM